MLLCYIQLNPIYSTWGPGCTWVGCTWLLFRSRRSRFCLHWQSRHGRVTIESWSYCFFLLRFDWKNWGGWEFSYPWFMIIISQQLWFSQKCLFGEIVVEMEIEISFDSKSSSSFRNAVSSVILSPPKVYLSSWLLQTFKPVKWGYPRSRGRLPPKLQPLITTQLFSLIFTNYLIFTNHQLPSLSKSFKDVKVGAEFSYNFHTNFCLHILHRSSILGPDVEIRMFRLGFGNRTSKDPTLKEEKRRAKPLITKCTKVLSHE